MSLTPPSTTPPPPDMARTIEIDRHGDVLLHFAGNHSSADYSPSMMDAAITPDEGLLDADGMHVEPSVEDASQTGTAFSLLVSSAILSLISPVFQNMFSATSGFSEAVAFRAPGAPRPFPIHLPDDDGNAFAVLANIAHHRVEAVPSRPSTQLLVQIAVLADKYDCAAALMPYGVLWLQRATSSKAAAAAETESRSLDDLCRMLLFAYVLDLPEQFAAVSWEILLQHRQDARDEITSGFDLPIQRCHELLRHDIHGTSLPPKTTLQARYS